MRENRSEQSKKYWAGLCAYLHQRGSQLESLEPMKSDYKHYRDFQIGIPGLAVRARQRVRLRQGLGVSFILRGSNATADFQSLKEQCAEIANEFGESLSWESVQSEKRIVVIRADMDPVDERDWPNQYEWLATNLERLVEVFRPRILELRANEAESFIEEQAEYVTSQSESNMPMHAYVVMLHLVSQGYTDFVEMRKVLARESQGSYYITILAYIFKKIEQLEEEWREPIPLITALVFNSDGTASKWTCKTLAGHENVQPTAKQIAELAASVAAYDKWDKVLAAFRL